MRNDLLNDTPLLQILQRRASQRTIDLESVDQDCDCDKTIGLHILLEFLVGGLVENDDVVGLVLDLWGG